MKDKKNYYITSAIAYTSAKPHVGNIYEIVLADAIARFKRAQALMFVSKLEQTSMDKKSRIMRLQRVLHQKNMSITFLQLFVIFLISWT